MVPFGCTRAPYYVPDPRCADGHGFHHGIDVAMRCGTRLYAARRVWVVSNDSLGPAYGTNPLLLRNRRLGVDLVIGHTRRVYVHEGDRVQAGTLIARASDNGAPDGCHLHFERRDVGGGLDTAHRPRTLLELTPTPTPDAAPWGLELGCPPWMSVLTRC
jgi:murein DD-endopeptidase MepM/ murein hydrolase activator NlpD